MLYLPSALITPHVRPSHSWTQPLLERLPEGDRTRVLARMERITGNLGELMFERNALLTFVDFPLAAVISVVVVMEDGGTAEAGTIDNEGMSR